MSTGSPYKFLDSYTKEDRDIFFGRDPEIEEVYSKVFQSKTLFVYGESGTGKSSLINCGLANKFKETDWLPVNVRRGNNIDESLLSELKRLTITPVTNLNGSFSKNLYKYTRSLYLDYFKPIYFIFDQFEELYLMGKPEEWNELIKGIKSLTERDLQVHFIFIIRAEYLHFMTEFEEEIPDIFNNKLRIEKITRMKAKECVEGPCEVSGITVEEGFTDLLFDQLSPNKNVLEFTYLQVFLDRVYKKAQEQANNGNIVFSKNILEDIGMVSDVLSDFLEEQVESMPDKDHTLIVLKSFVTLEGTKRQASVKDILSFGEFLGKRLDKETVETNIRTFLDRRILKELQDQDMYELRHDALADKILEMITLRERELIEVRQFLDYGLVEYQKRGFLLNDNDLAYIKPHLKALSLSGDLKEFVNQSFKSAGKKKRFRKRIIVVISAIVLLSITSIWGFFYAQKQEQKALEQKTLAEQSALEAQNQKSIAEQNAGIALKSQQAAEESASEANYQAQIANQQQLIADQQRLSAQSSQLEAEEQRRIALTEKDSAEAARLLALNYSQQAILERERAEKLSMQSLARSLGIKAAQLPDPEQKSLLALQAYKFNNQYKGYPYQADVYNGLYQAFKQTRKQDFNLTKEHTAAVTNILNADGRIYTTGSDGKIISWSDDLMQNRTLANTGMINNTMAISPNKQRVAIGTASSNVFIYDSNSGAVISRYTDHDGEVWKVLFMDDQNIITSGEDKVVLLKNINDGNVKELASFNSNAYAMAFNHQSKKLIVGLENGDVYQISIVTGKNKKVAQTGDMITHMVLNHNSTYLAVGFESGTIHLMDPTTFEILETLPGHTARISDLKFRKDNRFLISGGFDRRNLIWNMNRIKEQPIFITDHDTYVWAVGFINSGNEIVGGELSGVMKKYQLEMKNYAEILCDQASRNLTPKEWESFVGEDIPYQKTCAEY